MMKYEIEKRDFGSTWVHVIEENAKKETLIIEIFATHSDEDKPFAKDFATRKSQILTAVKAGQNLIINRAVSKEIPVIKISNKNQTVTGGECISLDNETLLKVQTKKKGSIKIFYNGKEIKSVISNSIKMLLNEVGKYRVEIKFGKRGFAYSNPILVY